MKTLKEVEEEFGKLVPEDVDILHEIRSDRIFCSRQAIVNLFRRAITDALESCVPDGVDDDKDPETKWGDTSLRANDVGYGWNGAIDEMRKNIKRFLV